MGMQIRGGALVKKIFGMELIKEYLETKGSPLNIGLLQGMVVF